MMGGGSRTSAGLLMYRSGSAGLEVLLVHPGGPFFVRKDEGAWTIPKGEPVAGEDLLTRARVEFAEELILPRFQRAEIDSGLLSAGNYLLALEVSAFEVLGGRVVVLDN